MSIAQFSFSSPAEIEFGRGEINQLSDKFGFHGTKRPPIVSDRGITKSGILEEVTAQLDKMGK